MLFLSTFKTCFLLLILLLIACIFLVDSFTGRKTRLGETTKNPYEIVKERLVVGFKIDIWIEGNTSNSSCMSPRWSGVLKDRGNNAVLQQGFIWGFDEHFDQISFLTVKYEAPRNVSGSWWSNGLILSWLAPETYPALAEVHIRPMDAPTNYLVSVSCLFFIESSV